MEVTQKEDVTAYAYTDDIVIGSKSLKKLQNTIDEVEKRCNQHKLETTEMMVFRTGGQIPSPTRITIEGEKYPSLKNTNT